MLFKNSIQGGRIEVFSSEEGWTLSEGSGDRSYWKRLVFEREFMHAPFVTVSLSGLDASKDSNLRLVLGPHNITPFGFDMEIRTWADTTINYVALTWMAYEIVE
ncbi:MULTISPECIES: H-type lectin domain-containing protein [unclassified Rhizobium]|uniref:H-type lectin domain-containing protein n=1 Tax=unclassified Rhizobium TaxID=2613769 RepID=UPI00084C623D|nr:MULTISPECIES: H-type lectin domain-containing protein [unclassified Rhizobium]OEC99850.1 hypothetical protein A9Z06_16810 [Rhizobium sp. YK2]